MPNNFFTFLGSTAHYAGETHSDGGSSESYCCQASDDYCVEWNDDDPTEGFAIFRSGHCVECSNLLTVATAIIMQETLDVDTFAENNVEQCENCGGYWIKGDLPERHSLGCRHETREEHAEREAKQFTTKRLSDGRLLVTTPSGRRVICTDLELRDMRDISYMLVQSWYEGPEGLAAIREVNEQWEAGK